MKKVKGVFKKLIIIYLIIYITLSSTTSCFARGYDEKCGEYASQWARDYIEKYASKSSYSQSTLGTMNGKSTCKWSGGSDGSGTFYGCCTCFVHWIYYNSLGVNIYDYGFDPLSDTAYSNLKGGNEYFDDVSGQELQAGDILIVNGHAEMYAGNGEHANFGGTPMSMHNACSRMTPGSGSAIAVRLKNSVDVNPAGTVSVGDDIEDENLSIYDENGFIYSGVAKIKGYKGSAPFGKWIISALIEILDYLIGILTLGIRIVIVGWTAIIERFVVDGIVNAVTGVTNERIDGWEKDPNTIDEIDRQAAEEEEGYNQSQATGNPGDEDYVSEGMQTIADIGGKVQLNTSSKANVTIENIVYNKIPILDINFFNFESAGGAVVDQNGIIYIIKTNVAMWYYIFRILSIVIMLLVLIYLGIQIALTSVTEKKAVYKQMLISWVVGFTIIFAINYIMYFIITLNETMIKLITPNYEDGSEISLYESVRSKAYEIKASTGFAGMVMYIILVYYAIRFLLVYFKRYLTVTILALLSPFIGVAYALQKVNKKGRGKGEIWGNWFKDFLYSVTLQSMHALIYTVFITVVLELTETSIIGIFIAFIFLHHMVRMDPILRKIFGLAGGKNTAKLSVDELMPKITLARGIGKRAVKVTGSYGNFLGKKFGAPIVNAASSAGQKMSAMKDELLSGVLEEGKKVEDADKRKKEQDRKKEEEAKKKARKQMMDQIGTGLTIGRHAAMMALKGATVVPMLIVESNLGIEMLSATLSSRDKLIKTLEKARKEGMIPKTASNGKQYKVKGVQPKNRQSANRLASRFNALGINFKLGNSATPQTNPSKVKSKITPQQRRELTTKININNLKFAKSGKDISEILDSDEGGIEMATAYAAIIAEAKKAEEELEKEYREIIGKLDDQIAEAGDIDPEFIKRLQEKKAKQLSRTAYILSQPLSEKDIYKAIQNYKSQEPTFDEKSERITQREVEGIAKEINKVLNSKGEDIQMSKEFVEKVQRELTESRRKAQSEQVIHVAGQDMTPKAEDQSLKEKVKTLNTEDKSNAYSPSNQNAPKQNTPGEHSSLENLVKNIKNASKGSSSKVSPTATRSTIRFTKNLEHLEQLSMQASELTGEELYDIDAVLKRLENL